MHVEQESMHVEVQQKTVLLEGSLGRQLGLQNVTKMTTGMRCVR
jgi:hypothetical protein